MYFWQSIFTPMKKQLQQVKEFQVAIGSEDSRTPTTHIPQRMKELRINLMQEELDEVKDAIKKEDIVNLAKELADVMYTVLGTAHTFGLSKYFEEVFEEVHKSNMTKVSNKSYLKMREDGKPQKTKRYIEPRLDIILKI